LRGSHRQDADHIAATRLHLIQKAHHSVLCLRRAQFTSLHAKCGRPQLALGGICMAQQRVG
jgi:hypothetical protein